METGPKLGSRNLGDFLQIKQDDNNVGPITGPNSSHSGVTLNSILSDKSGQIQPPPRVHSNRTLADIIRDESSAAAAAKIDGKRTWQLLKFKLRHHVSAGSSLTPPNNERTAITSGPGPNESTQPDTGPSLEHTSSLAMRLQSEMNDEVEEEEGNIPARTSLMALLAETDRQMGLDGSAFLMDNMDGQDLVEEEDHKEGGGLVVGYNSCCVCMVRHKGAAFIPCGHTFCRLCSRELWVQRGNCPLCNNCIVEILDIF